MHLLGAILAAILARKAAHPARTFVRITAGLTIVSLAVPAGAGATATAAKVTLAAAHILAASIVIPILACHLRPTRQVGRRPGEGQEPAARQEPALELTDGSR